jgi:nucleotide-binding universal stress UspA family protein
MFRSVVVGTDGSDRAGIAVQEAIDLAKAEGAKLCLVTAVGDQPTHWETVESSAKVETHNLGQVAESVLQRAVKRAEEQGVEVDFEVHEGNPADVLIRTAEDRGADVIVVGNKGATGAKRFLIGSVANQVSSHAPCTVMVVRTG